ncbi:ABC transporter permease [Paenibacillus selenitireducens]|nr:ABC transporter permease [Paenibacillus selenitireducens]
MMETTKITKTSSSVQWSKLFRSYGTVIAGILIIIMFSVLNPGSFATLDNAINISRQISFLVIIGIGATIVMSVSEFDLSIGAMASLGGVIAAKIIASGGPLWIAFVVPVLVALIIGFINGWIVTQFRVLSFITTLAMSTVLGGFTFWLTGGATIFENIPDSFRYIGQKSLGSIPMLSIVMLLVTILFWYVMTQTAFGRRLYAIGGNESASRIAGLRVKWNKNAAFALGAALAALTGVLMASRLGSAHPTAGNGLFLQAYAAAYLGMTSFKEGVPNIWGTFVGAAIIGVLANGLTIMEVPTFMQDVITGVIVIAAVIMQRLGRNAQ